LWSNREKSDEHERHGGRTYFDPSDPLLHHATGHDRRSDGWSIASSFGWRSLRGASSETATAEAGVSGPIGVRWFREGGGMATVSLAAPSGRHLSLAEREEIAILRAGGCGVREVARRLDRSPSTISRGPAAQRRDPRRPA
jgi:hypothetical protein